MAGNASSEQAGTAAPGFNSVRMKYSLILLVCLFLCTGNFKIHPALSQIAFGFFLVILRYLLEIMSSKDLKQIDHGEAMFSCRTTTFELLSVIRDEVMTADDACCVNQATELLKSFFFSLLFLEEASLTSRCFFPRS